MAKLVDLKNETFGVEIECVGVAQRVIAQSLSQFFETNFYYNDDNEFEISDKLCRIWKVVYDCSLSSYNSAEVVSPILNANDFSLLKEVIEIICQTNAFADDSCGVHVHIGGHGLNCKSLKNVVNSIYTRQDLLERALNIDGIRIRRYCRKFTDRFISLFNKAQTEIQLEDVWYDMLGECDRRYEHYNVSRYHLVNLHSFFHGHHTVEFRMFNGTIDADLILSYVQFCLAVVVSAKENSKTSTKPIVTLNEKFTMRNWLRKMGLNGKNFAGCRKVFLENLAGNTQYR